jgi:uncharacterized damage-inducible protein DinB
MCPEPQLSQPAMAFIKYFRDRALRTLRVARLFEDDDMVMRPGPGGRTTAELINHICSIHYFVRGLIEDAEPSGEVTDVKRDVSSARAAANSLAEAIQEVVRVASMVPAKQWDEPITPFGAPMPRRSLCYMMIEHEVHHCGEMYVYARMAGKTPPNLYEPVDESVLTEQ